MKKSRLSVALSIALLFNLLSFSSVSAEPVRDAVSPLSSYETSLVIGENQTLREQYAKFFQLSDGSCTIAMYDEPVHYKSGDEWIEIDNSLVPASLVGEPLTGRIVRNTALTAGEKQSILQCRGNSNCAYTTDYYENSANNFKVQLPKEISSNMPVVVNYEEQSLRFFFCNIADSVAEIAQSENENLISQNSTGETTEIADDALQTKNKNDFATAVHKNRSSISYPSINDDVDLNYYVSGQSLKENIIIHSLPSEESFSFEFAYTGLEAVLQEDQSVVFSDGSDKPIFVINAPFMFDSGEGYSSDVQVLLKKISTGCRYTLIKNREWLESEERIYPITLDPQVTTTQNSSYIHDNGVQQSNPATNYITADRLYVGSGSNSTQGRIYFKLTQWPSATGLNAGTINSAILNLTYYPQASWQTAYQTTIDVYKVSSAWDTSTITWNSQTGIGGTRISSKYIGDNRNKTSGYDAFDVTSWVKSHYSSPSTDYSIRLQPRTVANSINRACYISSDYYANTSLRPVIYINYFAGVKGVRNAPATPSYPSYNCQSYAFWLTPVNGTNVFSQFTDGDVAYCQGTTVANALVRTKTRMATWLNANFSGRWREVNSYDATLNSNEWLVCMRVGVVNGQFDYHYWYRANDGNWYNKHGYYNASEKVSGNVVNPSTANSSDGWKLGGTYFYTSSTVYYAIQQ